MKMIPLSRGFSALVDDEDYDWLNQWKWYANVKASGICYACRTTSKATGEAGERGQSTIQMHREILNGPFNIEIDHKDHNGLNNTRRNLRPCTRSLNTANQRRKGGSSRFKGVAWNKEKNKWEAYIEVGQVKHRLGYFADETMAAQAYDNAAVKAFGEFAYTNVEDKEVEA